MSAQSTGESRLVAAYRKGAIVVANTLVMLVVLNLVLSVVFAVKDARARRQLGKVDDLSLYQPELLRAAYPGLDPEIVDAMLVETRTRPLLCASFTHYLESPHRGSYVNVDEAGFRWNASRPPWPPDENALNVFVIGASTTFGYGVRDHETIPAYLQDELSRRRGGGRVHVYNFGQADFYSSQEQVLFLNLLRAGHRPDAVVFIDGYSEFFHVNDEPVHRHVCGRLPPRRFDLALLRLGRAVGGRLAPGPPVGSARERLEPTPENLAGVTQRYARNRRIGIAVADEFGVEPLFVWQPVSVYRYDLGYHVFASALSGDPELFDALRPGYELMSAEQRVWQGWDDFLYLADMQEGRKESLYVDRVHYTPAFHAEIAARIAEALVERLGRASAS